MHSFVRVGACAAAVSALVVPVATASADGGTVVVLDAKLRRCDFSLVGFVPKVPHPLSGTGTAMVRRAGANAVADVHLVDLPEPGAHFDVGLIQVPRSSAATCGPGDPGTAFTGLDIDAAGNGSATVQDVIHPGTTGVWVIVEQSNPNSQNPAEFYTSEFVAPTGG